MRRRHGLNGDGPLAEFSVEFSAPGRTAAFRIEDR